MSELNTAFVRGGGGGGGPKSKRMCFGIQTDGLSGLSSPRVENQHIVPQSRILDKCLGDYASFLPAWGLTLYEYGVHTLGSLEVWGARGLGAWPGGRGEGAFILAKASCLRQRGTGNQVNLYIVTATMDSLP